MPRSPIYCKERKRGRRGKKKREHEDLTTENTEDTEGAQRVACDHEGVLSTPFSRVIEPDGKRPS